MDVEVSVMDGQALIQRWTCTRTTMPDGAPAVLWRGVVYRLLPGDQIDVSIPAYETPPLPYAVVPGEEASWVLLQGMPAELDKARIALQRGGIVVSRSGRWLGESIGDRAFDWFLRCEGRLDEQAISALLGGSAKQDAAGTPAEAAILHQRIADLLADCARAQSALRHAMERQVLATATVPAEQDKFLQDALTQIAALESRLAAAPTEPKAVSLTPHTLRIHDEMQGLLTALRPDIILLRDSLQVALGEFQSRAGFYRALSELPLTGARPDQWKMLHGAERWWECHVSTGRNDHGRAYARFDTVRRQWSVLLSWKVEQAQDILWLKRRD